MSNILDLNKPFVSVGLGSFTCTLPSSQIYNVHVESTEVPPSGLVLTITDNGSTVYTAPVLAPTQGAFQFKFSFLGTSGHAIVVDLSSASAIDNQLNTVKSTITIGQGA